MNTVVRVSGFIAVVLFGSTLLLYRSLPETRNHHVRPGKRHRKPRIAVLLPLVGEAPPYIELFCMGAAGSAAVADFYILHTGVIRNHHLDCPANVKFIDFVSTMGLAKRLVNVVDEVPDEELRFSRDKLTNVIAHHIEQAPYVLVEWKMSLGYIFQDILQGTGGSEAPDYSHWAYSDLDIIFGDLPRWLTVDEFEYDIVTYGFGDQHRLYPRGQFTIHKNSHKVNSIWKYCKYLSRLDIRWEEIGKGNKYQFESAEGCYSAAILNRTDISVKYAVKAWTDQEDKQDSVHSHGVYLSRSQKHYGKHVLYKARSKQNGGALTELVSQWFEKDLVYSDRNQDLQNAGEERYTIGLPDATAKKSCMYWIRSEYERQICLSKTAVASTDTVYWIHGELFKEPYEIAHLENDAIVTAPFYHFQDWKRFYYFGQVANMHASSSASTFVLTAEGSIPIYTDTKYPKISSPLGLALKKDVWVETSDENRDQLPARDYCLASSAATHPARAVCDLTTNWNDTKSNHIVSGAPGWSNGNINLDTDVTLVLTLQISESRHEQISSLVQILHLNIMRWQGQPCVVVLFLAGASNKSIGALHSAFVSMQDDLENVLMTVVSKEEIDGVSRTSLLNMAIDAVPTRWLVSGLDLERGLILSSDSVALAHRKAAAHARFPGHTFWIPQFALNGDGTRESTISEVLRLHAQDAVRSPIEVEESCNDEDAVGDSWRPPNKVWWDLTQEMVLENRIVVDPEASLSSDLEELQQAVLELLPVGKQLDESPVLLVDNKGPKAGMKTHLMARFGEALGGRQCYNQLQMWQLVAMGYRMNVLSGAFAVSDNESRSVVISSELGDSRCDGCFFFEENGGKVVDHLLQQEISRAAKSAILWDEFQSSH